MTDPRDPKTPAGDDGFGPVTHSVTGGHYTGANAAEGTGGGSLAPRYRQQAVRGPVTGKGTAQATRAAGLQPRFFDKFLPDWLAKRRMSKRRRIAAMTPGRRIVRKVGVVGTALLAILTVLSLGMAVIFYQVSKVPAPADLKQDLTATVLYSDGSVMGTFAKQNRTLVTLDKVPESLRWAVIATEDRGFYSEPGFSVTGTARAVLSDLTGGERQGGSGITQQYVKNAYLSSEQTLTRKLKELAISTKLAREYSKDDILANYLNTVYFGRGAYGVQAASQAYFGVDVDKLNVAQGALLAGLLKAPSAYDPANDADAAQSRWNLVVENLVETKHLSTTDAAALQFPATVPQKDLSATATGPTQLIINRVKAELESDGLSEDEINQGGLTIKTTIDPTAQKDAEAAIAKTFGNLKAFQNNLRNALVAINPATGGVLAYYGGPNGTAYDGNPDVKDWAGVESRPVGSTMKPYVLATALKQTIDQPDVTPAGASGPYKLSTLVDGSFQKTIGGTVIRNDPGDKSVSSAHVTLANALKYSLNTTFDSLADTLGPAKVAQTAYSAGVAQTINSQKTLQDAKGTVSFGIGIGQYALRPVDQAIGYATFANGGKVNKAHVVDSAVDSTGKIVYSYNVAAANQGIDAKVANDVTVAMTPIAAYSGFALSGGRVSAAKTGTQGVGTATDNSDAWTVGFTPQVSVAVWTGSGDNSPIYNSAHEPEYGSDLPGKTWKLFIDTYLKGKPNLPLPTKAQVGVPVATATPQATSEPEETNTPEETDEPNASATVSATATPRPTVNATSTPRVVTTPAPTSVPIETATPNGGAPIIQPRQQPVPTG